MQRNPDNAPLLRKSKARRAELLLLLAIFVVHFSLSLAQQPLVIKLGTLAPRGSSYHQVLLQMGEKWRKAPGGVSLTVYPDGAMGGEAETVRRIRVGQIQAGMLTVVGLTEIDPAVGALQYMPMMFRSLDEVEYVRRKLQPELEKGMLDKGFVVLFWGDAGWVRFFSKQPVIRPADLKKTKIWVWSGDTYAMAIYKHEGYQPVSLETADILPGIQQGMITTIPTAPFIALAGQFFVMAPHMLELNWTPLVGGVVISKKAWSEIAPATREIMRNAADEAGQQMRSQSRDENTKAVEAMKKRGLIVHPVTPDIELEWRRAAQAAYPMIRGSLVPAKTFDQVERLLAEYRAHPQPPTGL
jgi:TRAP-type C4-dicarboxylate transport system substrate-binding protein